MKVVEHFDTSGGWMFVFNVHASLHEIQMKYDIPTTTFLKMNNILERLGVEV